MRHIIIRSCLLGSLLIFCATANIIETICMFVLFGIVPGMQESLSAQSMIGLYLTVCALPVAIYLQRQHKAITKKYPLSRYQTQA